MLLMLIVIDAVRNLVRPKPNIERQGFHLTMALSDRNKVKVVSRKIGLMIDYLGQ